MKERTVTITRLGNGFVVDPGDGDRFVVHDPYKIDLSFEEEDTTRWEIVARVVKPQ